MGSFRNHLDRAEQEREALNYVVTDADFSVDVYRKRSSTPGAGFSREVANEVYVDTINVRIDNSRLGVNTSLIALANSTNVMRGDIWRGASLSGEPLHYRVVGVTPEQSTTRAEVEVLVR